MQRTHVTRRTFAALALLAVLAACGGGGGGAPALAGSKLFVSDGGNHAIGSMINANPGAGTFAVDRVITGSATLLDTIGGTPSPSSIPSMALDAAADQLYAALQLKVAVFNQASLASGNVAPARNFTSSIVKNGVPHGVNFHHLFLDATNNRLYVADVDGFVLVFDNASGLTGSVTPTRTIQIDLGANTSQIAGSFGIAVDPGANNLFVGILGNGFTNIFIFNSQSGLSGPAAPSQTLTFSTAPNSFYLDRVNNRLYAFLFRGDVQVFNNANSLTTGTPTPTRTIPLSLVSTTDKFIFVDTTNDRLYAVGSNQVFIVPNASTINAPGFPATIATLPSSPNARFSAVVTKP